MITPDFDDETLMAFADGELDAETAAAVERSIGDDPALAERVAAFMESRALAKEGFAPFLDSEIPPALLASVEASVERARSASEDDDSRVVPFTPRPSPPPVPANANGARWAIPIAASLVLVAGAIGYLAGTTGIDPDAQQVALIEVPGLSEALATVASGDEAPLAEEAGQFKAIASFQDGSDRFCREFEIAMPSDTGYVAVACRGDAQTDWTVAFALSTGAAAGGYTPASSLDVLDAYLTGIDAGPPLSPEDEAAALIGQ